VANRFMLNVYNNSPDPGNVIVFQRYPEGNRMARSLVWLTKYANPQTRVSFEWIDEPCFVSSSTGRLAPGIIANVSGMRRADIVEQNQITLTDGGGPQFIDVRRGPRPGFLTISVDLSVQQGTASAGIGMSERPTSLMEAHAGFDLQFGGRSQIWIAFGTYASGQVLNVDAVGNAAQIIFAPNVSAMDATLGPDGAWTIAPTRLTTEV
jgi:hypothetical protein